MLLTVRSAKNQY